MEDIVKQLREEYANDEYMIAKLENYINELPKLMQTIKSTHEERKNRSINLSTEQDNFIHSFMKNNLYFYVGTTDKFFYYDKQHYTPISQDDVLYHILSSVTHLSKNTDTNLSLRKQMTKVYTLKKIKDKSLFKYAPESKTIQSVIGLFYPYFFSSKEEVKYFLTMLGDSILKKNEPLYHFIDIQFKPFLKQLNEICMYYIGTNIVQTVKYKYHDTHHYSQCRFPKIAETSATDILANVFQYPIDIFTVACHYSTRYGSSDNYLLNYSNNTRIINEIMFLKDKTPEELVDIFVGEYIQPTEDTDTNISWKNMLFLWRDFLGKRGIPAVMFYKTLQTQLRRHFSENDTYSGYTSQYLPLVQSFTEFWRTNIIEDIDSPAKELEIEEIKILFKHCNGITENIEDKTIINIMTFFFPHIRIVEGKYIYGVSCILWNKEEDVEIASLSFTNDDIDDMYLNYCHLFKKEKSWIVSKTYFEKTVERLNRCRTESL